MKIPMMKIDAATKHLLSHSINTITFGPKGASMCARLYLYRMYTSKKNVVVNSLFIIINKLETDHCKTAARQWRLAVKRGIILSPPTYPRWFI